MHASCSSYLRPENCEEKINAPVVTYCLIHLCVLSRNSVGNHPKCKELHPLLFPCIVYHGILSYSTEWFPAWLIWSIFRFAGVESFSLGVDLTSNAINLESKFFPRRIGLVEASNAAREWATDVIVTAKFCPHKAISNQSNPFTLGRSVFPIRMTNWSVRDLNPPINW